MVHIDYSVIDIWERASVSLLMLSVKQGNHCFRCTLLIL